MNTITKQNLKEYIGLNTPIAWNELYLEISYSNSGVARLFIHGRKSPFYAGGYGYCKNSTVLAEFINYYVGKTVSQSAGAGVEAVIADAKAHNIELAYICETKDGFIYRVKNLNVKGV